MMNPELKFHSIVLSVITTAIFLIWIFLNKLIAQYPFTSVILSGLVSLGVYRFVAIIFLSLFKKLSFIKKFILGPRFMEGVWVGFFVGKGNKIRLFVEIFEQDLSTTTIRGRSFREDGSYHGSWNAENVTIDLNRAKLTYHYQTDAIRNTFINPGIAGFEIDRNGKYKIPERLIGFSSDLFSPDKLMAFEEKVSLRAVYDSTEILEIAKAIYEKYKIHIQKDS